MKEGLVHCYIFDFNSCNIYHAEIPYINCTNDVIETYLKANYGFNSDEISFMLSNKPLNIIEL